MENEKISKKLKAKVEGSNPPAGSAIKMRDYSEETYFWFGECERNISKINKNFTKEFLFR